MKKTVFAVIAIVCVLAAAFLIGTGLQKRTDVLLTDYSVTEDGTVIRLDVQVASSMGYVRGFKNDDGAVLAAVRRSGGASAGAGTAGRLTAGHRAARLLRGYQLAGARCSAPNPW